MAAIAPIAFAFGGKLLFGKIGFAVGWLIGSWLYNRMQKKNEVTDTGAEEMPRFNQALRGTTMAVLFGTNRVSSNIVWQHDYKATRNDAEEGGGKFGGSGSKGATQAATGDYEYTWDLLYHLGMTRGPYTLLRGWLGADSLNSLMISSINASTAFEAPDEDDDDDDEETIISFSFDDAYFYSGDGAGLSNPTGEEGWDEILADEGVGVRWPHTAYIGFKQLVLGSYPSIPQFTWEVGPSASGEFSGDAGFIDWDDEIATAVAPVSPSTGEFIVGDDDRYYFIGYERAGENIFHVYRMAEDWTSFEWTESFDATNFTVEADDGNTYVAFKMQAGVVGTTHILVQGDRSAFVHVYMLFKINSSGLMEKVGDNVVGGGPLLGELVMIDRAGEKDDDDFIMVMWQKDGDENQLIILPPSSNFTGAYHLYSINVAGLLEENFANRGTHAYDQATVGRHFSDCWVLPTIEGGIGFGGITANVGHRLYGYITRSECKADVDAFGVQSTLVHNNIGDYPDGFIFYHEFALAGDGSLTWTGDLEIANDDFNVDVPFDDDCLEQDGVTVNYGFSYASQPTITKLTSGAQAGAYIVLFAKIWANASVGELTNPEKAYCTGRGFIYDPRTSTFTQVFYASAVPYNMASLFPTHTTYTLPGSRKLQYIEARGKVYGVDHCVDQNQIGADDRAIVYKFGNLDVGGATDVLPPEIIYEVMTNSVFGIGIPESDVDQDSYTAAKEYCRTNNFYVSTQYRREQSVLSLVEEVLATYGGFLIRSDSKYKFKQLEWLNGLTAPVRTIDNHHLVRSDTDEPPVRITKGALQDTFNKVRVNYIDRALDYVQNQVEESDEVDQDLQGIRMREFPPQFVMSEGMARTMALRTLWGNLYARDTYEFTLGWKDADLEPGDVITLVDSFHAMLSPGVTCRIVKWEEKTRGQFDVTAKQEFEYILTTSAAALNITSGDFSNPYSKVSGPKEFRAYELPYEFQDADVGRVYIGWAAKKFAAGAYIWMSPDGTTYSQVAKVSPYAIWGTLLSDLPNDPAVIENAEIVLAPASGYYASGSTLYDDTLSEANQGVRAVGASLFWVGSEMIAYQTVTLIDQNKYRIGRMFRGWGGTGIHAHASGDLFWKHSSGVYAKDFNRDTIGNVFSYKVQPYNLTGGRIGIESIDAQTYSVVGAHYAPRGAPTPRLYINSEDFRGKTRVNVGSEADVHIVWRDAGRHAGYGAAGYGTVGYGDYTAEQAYSAFVSVVGSGGTVVRSVTVSSAEYLYTNSNNFADNGAWHGKPAFRITPRIGAIKATRIEVYSLELWS